MKRNNLFSAIIILPILLMYGLACKSLLPSQTEESSANSSDVQKKEIVKTTDNPDSTDSDTENTDKPKVEKADFTVTAEELDKNWVVV